MLVRMRSHYMMSRIQWPQGVNASWSATDSLLIRHFLLQ